jgi:hypothetical protein
VSGHHGAPPSWMTVTCGNATSVTIYNCRI